MNSVRATILAFKDRRVSILLQHRDGPAVLGRFPRINGLEATGPIDIANNPPGVLTFDLSAGSALSSLRGQSECTVSWE